MLMTPARCPVPQRVVASAVPMNSTRWISLGVMWRSADRFPCRIASRYTTGYDALSTVKGRKRHIVVDTEGLLLTVLVHAASIQDRDGGADTLKTVRKRFPFLQLIWADGGYQGAKFKTAFDKIAAWKLSIVKRSDDHTGFRVLPRRWVVERTFAWIGRNRRMARDFERLIETATAYILIAMIQLMTRRLARR